MKLKKVPFVLSFALSTLLVVGTTGFASGGSENGGSGNMMNANDNGMMNACGDFMESASKENVTE